MNTKGTTVDALREAALLLLLGARPIKGERSEVHNHRLKALADAVRALATSPTAQGAEAQATPDAADAVTDANDLSLAVIKIAHDRWGNDTPPGVLNFATDVIAATRRHERAPRHNGGAVTFDPGTVPLPIPADHLATLREIRAYYACWGSPQVHKVAALDEAMAALASRARNNGGAVDAGLLRWVKAQADDPNANERFRELYAALTTPTPATEPAQGEALRDLILRMSERMLNRDSVTHVEIAQWMLALHNASLGTERHADGRVEEDSVVIARHWLQNIGSAAALLEGTGNLLDKREADALRKLIASATTAPSPAREAATAGGDNSANLHKDRRDKSPDLQKDGWIACSERLPPDGVTVLGYVQGAGDPYFCTIRANVIASMLAADDRRERGRPTHWMPLPAAPTAPDATGGAE